MTNALDGLHCDHARDGTFRLEQMSSSRFTSEQIDQLRKISATHKAVCNVYHSCLERDAPAAVRHAAEAACTAAWQAKVEFSKTLI